MFELLVCFWEDFYRKNPRITKQSPDGTVTFQNTGDPLIDKWEREIAQGLLPDLLEGLSPERREKEKKAMERLKRSKMKIQEQDAEGFEESYA